MRRSTVPPRSAAATPYRAIRPPAEAPQRKVFHCIVDETALMAGVKKSTRDGIRKWIAQGAIRLYVPLHTLTQLHRLSSGTERINADAREAVKWLDEATSLSASADADRVQLEGVDEAYTKWDDVEQFLLPETLLSMDIEDSEPDDDDHYHEDLESSFNALDVSDETSMSSTHSSGDLPKTPESPRASMSKSLKPNEDSAIESTVVARTVRNSTDLPCSELSSKGVVPNYLQPLFNHILWRIKKETNPDAALEFFILLTNDPTKHMIAQKFGVRAKRLEQLRDAVAREDREYKNHMTVHKLEVESTANELASSTPKASERPKSSSATESIAINKSDDEDVVLFSRVPRGPAASTIKQRVFDPNDFARTKPHQSPRGGRGGTYIPPRGRGAPPTFRGRGSVAPRGAYVPPSPAFRAAPASRHDPNQPLDPDSFTRPIPKMSPVRGGGRRKLWEPN